MTARRRLQASRRGTGAPLLGVIGLLLAGAPAVAQAPAETALKVAVIDVQRILTDSQLGKEALARLQSLEDSKTEEARQKQEEIRELRERVNQGRLSLSQDRLDALQKEMEEKVIAFQRFQDDANRELKKLQEEAFARIESQVLPIINEVGVEGGFTLIFNKFNSGLVFAHDRVDITDLILQRFDASVGGAGEPGEGGG